MLLLTTPMKPSRPNLDSETMIGCLKEQVSDEANGDGRPRSYGREFARFEKTHAVAHRFASREDFHLSLMRRFLHGNKFILLIVDTDRIGVELSVSFVQQFVDTFRPMMKMISEKRLVTVGVITEEIRRILLQHKIEVGRLSTEPARLIPRRNDQGKLRKRLTIDDWQIELNSSLMTGKKNRMFIQPKSNVDTGEGLRNEHRMSKALLLTMKISGENELPLVDLFSKETSSK